VRLIKDRFGSVVAISYHGIHKQKCQHLTNKKAGKKLAFLAQNTPKSWHFNDNIKSISY